MCPDDQILSQYFDGEVDLSTKEMIESHVDDCWRCRKRIEAFTNIRFKMLEEDEIDIDSEKEQVYRKIENDYRFRQRKGFWDKKWLIPAPVVVVSSIVICILFSALFVTLGMNQKNTIALKQQRALHIQMNEIQLDDLNQFFDSQDFMIEAKMELPAQGDFSIMGEPQLLRAVDSKRR